MKNFLTTLSVCAFALFPFTNATAQTPTPDENKVVVQNCILKGDVESEIRKMVDRATQRYYNDTGIFVTQGAKEQVYQQILKATLEELGKKYVVVQTPEKCPAGLKMLGQE